MKFFYKYLMVIMIAFVFGISMMPRDADAITVTPANLQTLFALVYSDTNVYSTTSFTFNGLPNDTVYLFGMSVFPDESNKINIAGISGGNSFEIKIYGDGTGNLVASEITVLVDTDGDDILGWINQSTGEFSLDPDDDSFDETIISINGGSFGDISVLQYVPGQLPYELDSIVMVTTQPDCSVNADCDDGIYCNGIELCSSGECVAGTAPCLVELCDEASETCDDCVINDDCDDGLFCNGDETCFDGACVFGTDACEAGEICDEVIDECIPTAECETNADCNDDSFCNGAEICSSGECIDGSAPCLLELCDEGSDTCDECFNNNDCDDDVFCNGAETCSDGECVAGTDPCLGERCDETDALCVECLNDSDCEAGETCENDICVQDVSPVTEVTLKGPGELVVDFAANGIDIDSIDLTGTTVGSSLTIKSKLKDTAVNLNALTVDGSLKAIKGKTVVLTGEMTATGGIAKMQIAGTDPGSSIQASWIGKLSITFDFSGDMELTGAGSPPKGLTLGKLSIKGWFWFAQLQVSGHVGSVKVGTWGPGGILAVGVDPGIDSQFFTNDDFATGGALGKFGFKEYFTASDGERYGIIADEFLKSKFSLPFDDDNFCIWEK